MGLLLLLTYTLLCSYVLPGTVVDAQLPFTIRNAVLSIEPSPNVTRGTDVTVRCKATLISTPGNYVLSREYTIYKDNEKIYTKNSSTSDDLLYPLQDVKVSNIGKYKCSINIEGVKEESKDQKLTVTGLSKPVLHLNNSVVTESDEVTATCTAPNETGSIFFYFYEGSNVIAEKKGSRNQLEVKLFFSSPGIHVIHCTYTVSITPHSYKSEKSEAVVVSVKELTITLVMEIYPQSNIYEGDHLNILCYIRNLQSSSKGKHLYLSQGDNLLSNGDEVNKVNHSMTAMAKNSGKFECLFKMGGMEKVVSKTVSVREVFSAPTVTMDPGEIFQKDRMTLTCKSEIYASEKLNSGELIYSVEPDGQLIQTHAGVFSGKAMQYELNYTCVAQARGIRKHSKILTIYPKVSVSSPKISLVGRVILGEPFNILCQSNMGSLPINYTLLKNDEQVDTHTVSKPFQQAYFRATISSPAEISNYMCQAKNRHKEVQHSEKLNGTVIVPLSKPQLLIHPNSSETYEGEHFFMICAANGTAPVTYKWYHNGNKVQTNTTNQVSMDYQVQSLSKADSGEYYCEAVNQADTIVRSDKVTIQVYMALWKQILIGGAILVAIMLVVVCVMYFKSKRGNREAAAELSVKPSSPKSDDSVTANITHNTEVYNAATAKVDKVVVSVWSEQPPDAANDEVSCTVSSEPDVEYTEVVHPQPVDHAKVPLRKGTDTVYSELKNSPQGAADHHDYGSVEYAEFSGEQPEINHFSPEVHNYQDLPVPVD